MESVSLNHLFEEIDRQARIAKAQEELLRYGQKVPGGFVLTEADLQRYLQDRQEVER